MAPVGQYVFAEMLVISEHFTAGSHKWLPYSRNLPFRQLPAFPSAYPLEKCSTVSRTLSLKPSRSPEVMAPSCISSIRFQTSFDRLNSTQTPAFCLSFLSRFSYSQNLSEAIPSPVSSVVYSATKRSM